MHALVVLRHEDDTAGSRPWAVLTDRDVLRNAADAERMTAGDVASAPVLVARPSDALADVATAMVRDDTSHVVVVDARTGRPVGIVSTLDIAGIVAWGRA